jgi:hypothetical protein
MKKITLILTAALIAGVTAHGADDKKAANMDPKRQEMMKKFMEYSTPSEGHKILKDLAGRWNYTSKMWESADSKPEESKGTSVMKAIFGGRFLEQEFKGKAMGQKFEGLGFIGYNNVTKKYETTWLDNMSTGIMSGKGEMDTAAKTIKEEGEFTCPIDSDHKREYRSEWKIIDKNNMVYTMSGEDMDGKDHKMMEITYKRAK